MRILVINVGTATVKLGVFELPAGITLAKQELAIQGDTVAPALARVSETLSALGISAIDAVGHRVVHGGEAFREAVRIDPSVIRAIETLNPLAPLHNPPALAAMRMMLAAWPDAAQVAVFDTSFHAGMPSHAAHYAVPEAWRRSGVRRFGFHGTSHKYVMERVGQALDEDPRHLRILSCHLGNGASVCAIEHGVSVDTSMGMTPLEGLVMGARPGDVDPGIFAHVERQFGLQPPAIESALYHDSGLAALSGRGRDLRDIDAGAAEGDPRCELALSVYSYRARKYIGAYAAAMGGLDVLAFTGGIGENSAAMRHRICDRLGFLGIALDQEANAAVRLQAFEAIAIHAPSGSVRVLVMQAQEQWMIAQEVHRLLTHTPPTTRRST